MKTIKAVVKWFQKCDLTPREQHRVDDLFTNIKISIITLVVAGALLWMASTTGCFSENLRYRD
jgi:uncharacterized protein (DUF983 family)